MNKRKFKRKNPSLRQNGHVQHAHSSIHQQTQPARYAKLNPNLSIKKKSKGKRRNKRIEKKNNKSLRNKWSAKSYKKRRNCNKKNKKRRRRRKKKKLKKTF